MNRSRIMFFACLLALDVRVLAARSILEEEIERILARPELKTSTLGICAVKLGTGEVVLAHNADKLLAPASNTKLVSCAGALAALGKDFRFETRVVASAAVKDGALPGDLVLVASGDPNLSQRVTGDGRLLFEDKDHSYAGFFEASLVPGDPLRVVKELARQVRAAGVREIRGDVTVDDGLFQETEDDFVGTFSAICVNDNLVDVTVTPGARPSDPARIEVLPAGSLIEVVSLARTEAPGSETTLWLEPRGGVASFTLQGKIAADSRPVVRSASFRDPATVAASFLREALEAEGVKVRGHDARRRLGPAAYSNSTVLARHISPPFSEALKVILKVSQNLHATMLPVLVGALKGGAGNRESGFAVMRAGFEKDGLDTNAVVLESGSGGGRADHVSARWMVDLLRAVSRRESFGDFVSMLPVGGVDGTLASAFKDGAFGKRVHAKTGTLVYRGSFNDRWIYMSKSLSGYLFPAGSEMDAASSKDLVAFSIIIANTISESRKKGADDLFRAQEDILRAIAASLEAAAGNQEVRQ